MFSDSTSNWLYSASMNAYIGSAKYEYVHSFLSRMIWSILSSALKTTSVPELLSRLFSFMRTVAELRPPRLYSVLSTTIGSLPCMMTLPARISWAIFMAMTFC